MTTREEKERGVEKRTAREVDTCLSPPENFTPERERERGRDSAFATRKIAGGEGEKNCMKRENYTYGTVVDEKRPKRERGWRLEKGVVARSFRPVRSASRAVAAAIARRHPRSLARYPFATLRLPENTGETVVPREERRRISRLPEVVPVVGIDRRSTKGGREIGIRSETQGCLRVTSSRLKRSSLSLFLSLPLIREFESFRRK